MKQALIALILLTSVSQAHAFTWQDLWVTKDRQAQTMMDTGQFSEAQATFEDTTWLAAAAYRAGNYKDAVKRYQSLKNNRDACYNQGNAYALSSQLKSAITAYDKALAIDPNNQDALHNRKIVEELLKKENEKKKDQKKQDQDKQNQDKPSQDKPSQDKQHQDKQDQNKQDQDKKENVPENLPESKTKQEQSKTEQEKQQAKEQLLHLIPDDPGGLMREKFLRDYLSRQRNPD